MGPIKNQMLFFISACRASLRKVLIIYYRWRFVRCKKFVPYIILKVRSARHWIQRCLSWVSRVGTVISLDARIFIPDMGCGCLPKWKKTLPSEKVSSSCLGDVLHSLLKECKLSQVEKPETSTDFTGQLILFCSLSHPVTQSFHDVMYGNDCENSTSTCLLYLLYLYLESSYLLCCSQCLHFFSLL